MRLARAVLASVALAIAASSGLLWLAGCSKQAAVRPCAPHPRIVTYSPALTDMVFQMGLGDHVVGVTTQCILPPGEDRKRVGDAFSVSSEPILAVKPDVILVQVKADKFQTLHQLAPDVKIEHFDIEGIQDIPRALARIGDIAGRKDVADKMVRQFEVQLQAVRQGAAGRQRPRVLFVMGYKQPSTGGGDTFIGQMIEAAGGVNAAEELKGWQNLNIETIIKLRPDVIVCWVDKNFEQPDDARNYWLALRDLPASGAKRVFVVSDRYWTIPTLRTPEYIGKLADMLHGQSASSDAGETPATRADKMSATQPRKGQP